MEKKQVLTGINPGSESEGMKLIANPQMWEKVLNTQEAGLSAEAYAVAGSVAKLENAAAQAHENLFTGSNGHEEARGQFEKLAAALVRLCVVEWFRQINEDASLWEGLDK